MTNQEFELWVEGFITLTSEDILDDKQFNIIFNHANLVKAVSGSLDKNNKAFIAALEAYTKRTTPFRLSDLKALYNSRVCT